MKIYNCVDELIGNTPLVRLSRLEKQLGADACLLAKLESVNPAGSVKDRVAREMLDDAERRGLITPGATIIEPTSGNTGIGLCSVGAARGYKVIIVMPDSMSKERRLLMSAFGAQIVLTDGKLGMKGAIAKAEELKEQIPGSFIPGQFSNPANPEAHRKTTAPEIVRDTDGNVDIFVCGVGTGGTVTGVGSYLKAHVPGVRIVGVEPAGSAVLSGKQPGPHGLQGIGAGFVPDILDTSVYDEIIPVTEDDAYRVGRLLATSEGILAGITSGAALHAAALLAKRPENKGKNIVVLLPDTGDRYLSTALFDC